MGLPEMNKNPWNDFFGDLEIGEFKPVLSYYPTMDFVLMLTEDVGYVSDLQPGGLIELLYHPQDQKRLVGVKINCVSQLVDGSLAEIPLKPK
jgi:hypothetical protein